MLPELLNQTPPEQEIGSATADCASDTRKCHDTIADRGANTVIPPRKNTKRWKPDTAGAIVRNKALRASKYLGLALWRKWCGYHRRSRAETKMHCMKLLAQKPMARDPDRQVAELQLRVAVMNGFPRLAYRHRGRGISVSREKGTLVSDALLDTPGVPRSVGGNMVQIPKFPGGENWSGALFTLALGTAGAFLFAALGLPAPFLTGPALTVSLASVAGRSAALPALWRDATFVVLGVGIGASVTPEVLAGIVRWPISLAALAVTLVAIMLGCRAALTRWFGFDPLSAMLASAPGHLSYVLALSESQGADTARIALVQSMRVLFLTLAVPAVIALAGLQAEVPSVPPPPMTLAGGAASFAAALVTAALFRRLRMPAALLLGAMLASAVLHGSGIVAGRLPVWLGDAAFIAMGVLIGTRFRGQTWGAMRAALGAGLAVTAIGCALAGLAAAAVAALLGMPMVQVLIAFAPGGLEAMIAMSLLTGADPAFVAANHVGRMMFLSLLVPVMLRRQR